MLLDEAYILNEKFSMDNWKKKDYDRIIDEIIKDENPNIESSGGDCYEIQMLNIPNEVKDLIVADYIDKEIPKQIKSAESYMSPERFAQYIKNQRENEYTFENLDAWYILEHPYARKYIDKFLMNEFKKTYYWIESLGNPLTLYRFIHFDYNRWGSRARTTKLSPEDFGDHILKNSNIHLGVCWTPHFDKAEEFGSQEHTIDEFCMIIEAKVPRDAINLPNTLIKRSELTYYHYEDEIELIKGSPIMVESVWFPPTYDEWLQGSREWIDNYKHKIYKV